jgi:opacity protein-like surface antigen
MPFIKTSSVILAASLFPATLTAVSAADLPLRTAPPAPPVFVQQGGFYFGNRNSVSVLDETSFNLGSGAIGIATEYDVGFSNALVLGYNFGSVLGPVGPRIELEAGRSQFSVDTHRVNGALIPGIDSFGETKAFTGFASAFVDFNLFSGDGWLSRVKPYVGAGVGFANVELRKHGVAATGVVMKDSDTGLAFHLSAGLGIEIFERTTLELGYRYTQADDLSFTARDGTKSKSEITSNAVTFGLRRQF